MGGVVHRLVQPPAPPQQHQVRHAPATPQRQSGGDLSAPCCRLRTGVSATSAPLVRLHSLLASTGRGLDQPASSRNRYQSSYVDVGCLNGSRGVIFPGSYRSDAHELHKLVDHDHPDLSVSRQCGALLGLPRSTLYYRPPAVRQSKMQIMARIDALYLGPPEKVSRSHSRQGALPR